MLTLKIMLALYSALAFAASGGGLIGNGGDAVKLGNRLVLRDLAEVNPGALYFGKSTDHDLVAALIRPGFQHELPVDFELLARKLTDLNKAYPELGLFVIQALSAYHYKVVNEDLPLLPNEPSKYLASQRVQIAVRNQDTILISGPRFRQLDEVSKVALFIHEGLYSLLRVQCAGDFCTQESKYVRPIVARFFQSPNLSQDAGEEELTAKLNIPSRPSLCRIRAFFFKIFIARKDWEPFQSSAEPPVYLPMSGSHFPSVAGNICQVGMTFPKGPALSSLMIYGSAFRQVFQSYHASFGTQFATGFEEKPVEFSSAIRLNSFRDCVNQLKPILQKFDFRVAQYTFSSACPSFQ